MGLISKEAANSKAIFKHLCDQMHKLSAKQISVDEAKAQANMAKQANNILKHELERAKTVAKYADEFRDIEDENV